MPKKNTPKDKPSGPLFQSLGQAVNGPSKDLETFPAASNVTEVCITSHELTAFCPVTHQPDFYTITIFYQPKKHCLESKSLKRYLWSFRDKACFAESLAHEMANDIMQATQAHFCKITLEQQVRGGLQLTAVAQVGKKIG